LSDYPRDLTPESASPRLLALIEELTRRLLDGPTPAHRTLLQQLAHARVREISLTGAGLFAEFATASPDRVSPAEWIGGEVEILVEGLDASAGSLVKVSDGRLDSLEIYTHGIALWPDDPHVISLRTVAYVPVPPAAT